MSDLLHEIYYMINIIPLFRNKIVFKFTVTLCAIIFINTYAKVVLAQDNLLYDTNTSDEHINFEEYEQAEIIALNKITAQSQKLLLKLNELQYFGNIAITVHKCVKVLDPYNLNNMILMTITENTIDDDPIIVFQGWLMSADISVSTLVHPVYEIFAKDCL